MTKYERYNQSAKGRARRLRYDASQTARDRHARFNNSTKGIVRRVRHAVAVAHAQEETL